MPRTRKKDTSKEDDFYKQQKYNTLIAAVDIMIRKTENNNGRLSHGLMRKMLLDLKKFGIKAD
jgi:hypothetical protein